MKSWNSTLKLLLMFGLLTVTTQTFGSSLTSYEIELLKEINSYRQKNNLKPLEEDSQLSLLARQHSLYMYEKKALSHDYFKTRFTASQRRECVENVGFNYKTGKAMFEGWRTSSGHNENMLNKQIKFVGIARMSEYITFFACY